MPQTSRSALELQLAESVVSYIQVAHDGSISQEQETLRWVCAGLEFLLGSLLQQCEGWNGWLDGIFPATDMLTDAVVLVSGTDLEIRGQALWGEHGRGKFWIEPFLGLVRVTKTYDAVLSYEISFADAARGLATFRHDKHVRRVDWFYPERWMFVFSKNMSGEENISVNWT